jgi:hypothetical protein
MIIGPFPTEMDSQTLQLPTRMDRRTQIQRKPGPGAEKKPSTFLGANPEGTSDPWNYWGLSSFDRFWSEPSPAGAKYVRQHNKVAIILGIISLSFVKLQS